MCAAGRGASAGSVSVFGVDPVCGAAGALAFV
jgi:hypothetical protein